MMISRNEQTIDVPRSLASERWCPSTIDGVNVVPSTFPYASGQGPLVTVPSAAVVDGHVPSAYMELNILKLGLNISPPSIKEPAQSPHRIGSTQRCEARADDTNEPRPQVVVPEQMDP